MNNPSPLEVVCEGAHVSRDERVDLSPGKVDLVFRKEGKGSKDFEVLSDGGLQDVVLRD